MNKQKIPLQVFSINGSNRLPEPCISYGIASNRSSRKHQESGRKSIQEIIRKMKHSTLSSTRETHSSTRYDKMHVIIGFISFVFLRHLPSRSHAQIVYSQKDVCLVKYAFFLLIFFAKFVATSSFLFPIT